MSDQDQALALTGAALTNQERAFVDALVQDPDFDLAAAAKAVGLEGRSPLAAAQAALKRPQVVNYLSAIHADRLERHRQVRDGCVSALWQLAAGYDIAGMVDESGRVLAPDKLPASLRAAVKSVRRTKEGWDYQFADRAQILALLLKHFGESTSKSPEKDQKEGKTVVEYRDE